MALMLKSTSFALLNRNLLILVRRAIQMINLKRLSKRCHMLTASLNRITRNFYQNVEWVSEVDGVEVLLNKPFLCINFTAIILWSSMMSQAMESLRVVAWTSSLCFFFFSFSIVQVLDIM